VSDALGIRGVGGIRAEACRGVVARTSSRSLRNSRTCARVMRKGGKRRSVKSWVQLISKPRCRASLTMAAFDGEFDADHQAFAAYGTNKIEFSSELGETFAQFGAAREDIFEKIFILDNAEKFNAVAQASGPPPKVVPCIPAETREATSSVVRIAPRGRPAASGLAIKTMSGLEEISDRRSSGRCGRARIEFHRRSGERPAECE